MAPAVVLVPYHRITNIVCLAAQPLFLAQEPNHPLSSRAVFQVCAMTRTLGNLPDSCPHVCSLWGRGALHGAFMLAQQSSSRSTDTLRIRVSNTSTKAVTVARNYACLRTYLASGVHVEGPDI